MISHLLLSAIVVFLLVCGVVECSENYKIIESHSGPIRGKLSATLFDQKPYYAFRGIPYAEPPVDKLRFKAPVAKVPWTETLDAFDFGSTCIQNVNIFGESTTVGSEDCLFLNVYTPEDFSSANKRAVMIFIHGGGFVEGSGNDDFYGPDFLLNEDVIVVTLNYRLGVFGFMSLGTPEYSGNMGLKDQKLALKWINKNIELFGGDTERITVFGHSAGAASTHYQVLSEESNSLFQRAIVMSGSAVNHWSYYPFSEHMLHMFVFAKTVGIPVSNDKDLVRFLNTVDANDVMRNIDTAISLGVRSKELELLWAPVIELQNAKFPFIQTKPEEILDNKLNNKIDTMFGFTSDEGLFLISNEVNNPDLLEPFDEHFELQLSKNKQNMHYDTEEYKELAQEIRNFYFRDGAQVTNETLTEYNDMLSDLFIVYGVDKAARGHGKNSKGKTYYYRFSVDAKLNMFKIMFKVTSMAGSSHGDELCYIFRCNVNPQLYDGIDENSVEMKTIRSITKLWTNFAKFRNPTPNNEPIKLKPIHKDHIHFVDITNDGLIAALGPHQKFTSFWRDILSRYGNYLTNLESTGGKDEL